MKPATRLSYGTEPAQFGELRLPEGDGPHPVALTIHGGFWMRRYGVEAIALLADALTDAGWATWSIEYRRIGEPEGGWPGTFLDVARAADHVRELASSYPLDADRAIAVGHSAGGHLALWLAARHRLPAGTPLYSPAPLPLRGVVALAAVADLRRACALGLGGGAAQRLLGGAPADFPQRCAWGSPAEALPLGVRQVLFHGTSDHNVPPEMSRAYRDSAVKAGDDVELIELEGADHFELVTPTTPHGKKVVEVAGRFMA